MELRVTASPESELTPLMKARQRGIRTLGRLHATEAVNHPFRDAEPGSDGDVNVTACCSLTHFDKGREANCRAKLKTTL
jgi:hypothetical protein